MNYIEQLKGLKDISMDLLIDLSFKMLPAAKRDMPWQHVGGHGTQLLTTEDQMSAYIAAYGEMHQAKCRSAFQNFDFDALKTNFEIVDWGCGQGVGSLTFIDMLKTRQKEHLLRKITLIEPSGIALGKANFIISKATKGSASILPVQKYLPGIEVDSRPDVLDGIKYSYTNVIHIFSNILDVDEISLEKVAQLIAQPGHTHYIMCMGPKNTNSYRIDEFCSVFSDAELLSDIDNPNYGILSRTYHNYSCKIKCLKFNGEKIDLSFMTNYDAPTLVCGKPVYNDYDPDILVQNGVISKALSDFYDKLSKCFRSSDNIFFKPNINGDTPDIVVVRKGAGVLLVKVFEDNLLDYRFDDDKSAKTDRSRVLVKGPEGNTTEILSPITVLSSYQQNFVKLHIRDMYGKTLLDSKYWSIIKTVVYFAKNTDDQVKAVFKDINLHYCNLLSMDFLKVKDPKKEFEKVVKMYAGSKLFSDSIYKSVINCLSPAWHSYKEGKYINLTRNQLKLSKSAPGMKKINGVSGSGKTQVLTHRAVNANLRTGKKVLILTFNLSLVNYIKYRLSEVRADFYWNNFNIINYHQFFLAKANNLGLRVGLSDFENTHFFAGCEDSIEKYSAILIDEIQDYKTEWLFLLRKYFLAPDGELVVFGDAKQNIYGRELDVNGQVKIGVIPGSWDNSLNAGFRFSNPKLTDLAMQFQKEFFKVNVDDLNYSKTLAFNTNIEYFKINKDTPAETIFSNCMWIVNKYNLKLSETVVLSQSCDILREVSEYFTKYNMKYPLTTFESQNQYESLKEKHGIDETDPKMNYFFWDDIKTLRRNKKIHFTMDAPGIKMSTIHSYKGWEAKSVILVLEPYDELAEGDDLSEVKTSEIRKELIYICIKAIDSYT